MVNVKCQSDMARCFSSIKWTVFFNADVNVQVRIQYVDRTAEELLRTSGG